MSDHSRYVLLPKAGLKASSAATAALLRDLPSGTVDGTPANLGVPGVGEIRVLDSVEADGPKLIEIDDASARVLNGGASPFRALPIVEYEQPNPRPLVASVTPAAGQTAATFEVLDSSTGAGVPGADVYAFTSYRNRWGAQGTTDANGSVTMRLPGTTIERLFVYPPPGYWGAYRSNLGLGQGITIRIEPVDLSYVDCVRHYYRRSRFDATTGVSVGVLDTGVGPHADLNIVGGRNTVTGELAADFLDASDHGTHVAGLIGSNAAPPMGLRGMAPGVPIRAYRVFGAGTLSATNYAVLKAMIFAAADGCDIINLSLGGGPADTIVAEAIRDARNQGMLVVCAAGNDDRRPVNYPGAYAGATAVSAMGREGTFPAGSLEEADVVRPPDSTADPLEFLAKFSNVGPQIVVTGLGVGTLSTLPRDQHGPMSGTSMAAPVVAGATACLLSRDIQTFRMPRDAYRSAAIERLLQSSCTARGFQMNNEGYGLPDPRTV